MANKEISAPDLISNIGGHAALSSLPSSYGLLLSTFVDNNLSIDSVIKQVSAKHRRREKKGETVNEHGLLAKFPARRSKDQGKEKKKEQKREKWCELHKVTTHNTAECRSKDTFLPWDEYKKKKDGEKGMSAKDGVEEKETQEEHGNIATEAALEAMSATPPASLSRSAIVINSGATNMFI